MIKRYPGGRFSGLLGDRDRRRVDELGFTGPYGALRLRDARAADPDDRRRLGDGADAGAAAPARRRAAASARSASSTARGRDETCSTLDEIARSARGWPTSSSRRSTGRFVHEAVDDLTSRLDAPDVYMCGPPPMVEAAEAMLIDARQSTEQRIFNDKFTTAADATPARGRREPPAPTAQVEPARPAATSPSGSSRGSAPRKRRATLYEDVTIDTQPSVHRHLSARLAGQLRGRPRHLERRLDRAAQHVTGSPSATPASSGSGRSTSAAPRSSSRSRARCASAAEQGLLERLRAGVGRVPARLPADPGVRRARPVVRAGDRRARLPVGLGRHLRLPAGGDEAALGAGDRALRDGPRAASRLRVPDRRRRATAFLADDAWQPTRRYLERLAATADWGEVMIAANLCFEPMVGR